MSYGNILWETTGNLRGGVVVYRNDLATLESSTTTTGIEALGNSLNSPGESKGGVLEERSSDLERHEERRRRAKCLIYWRCQPIGYWITLKNLERSQVFLIGIRFSTSITNGDHRLD